MLEAYFEHPYSTLFFVVYLGITFYFLMNVVSIIEDNLSQSKCKAKFDGADDMHANYMIRFCTLQLLAIVYGSFEEEELKKFKKIYKHKL